MFRQALLVWTGCPPAVGRRSARRRSAPDTRARPTGRHRLDTARPGPWRSRPLGRTSVSPGQFARAAVPGGGAVFTYHDFRS
jgi:hypothetical protein